MTHHSAKPRTAAAATVGVIGVKTARACDNCILRRARWYCAADDAFLCELCDSDVHSANPLARRHKRLRLKSSSSGSGVIHSLPTPTWHHGFKRKARTPRTHHHTAKPVVPELETSAEDDVGNEAEQLLYRVPVFDPALSFCLPPEARDHKAATQPAEAGATASNDRIGMEFSPLEVEMSEFSADMESLLGRGLDGGDAFCMEELGLVVDVRDIGGGGCGAHEVKAEREEEGRGGGGLNFEMEVDLSRETLDLDFNCGSPEAVEEMEEEEEKPADLAEEKEGEVKRGVGLRLDYEAVMEAWSVHGAGSLWTSGERPQLGPEEYWLQCMVDWTGMAGRANPVLTFIVVLGPGRTRGSSSPGGFS